MVQRIEDSQPSINLGEFGLKRSSLDSEAANDNLVEGQEAAFDESVDTVVPAGFDEVSEGELARIIEPGTYTPGDFLDKFVPNLRRHTIDSFLELNSPRQLCVLRIAANRLEERIGEAIELEEFSKVVVDRLVAIKMQLRAFIAYTYRLEREQMYDHEHISELGNQLGEYKTESESVVGEGFDGPMPRGIDIFAEDFASKLKDGLRSKSFDPHLAMKFFIANTEALWEEKNPFSGRADIDEILPLMFEKAIKMGRLKVEVADWFINGDKEEFGNAKNPEYTECFIRGAEIVSIEMDAENSNDPLYILEREFCVLLKPETSIFGKHRTGRDDQKRTFRVDDVFYINGFDRKIGPCVQLICLRNDLDVWVSPKDIQEIVPSDEMELH
jgi:hypothetical protein